MQRIDRSLVPTGTFLAVRVKRLEKEDTSRKAMDRWVQVERLQIVKCRQRDYGQVGRNKQINYEQLGTCRETMDRQVHVGRDRANKYIGKGIETGQDDRQKEWPPYEVFSKGSFSIIVDVILGRHCC